MLGIGWTAAMSRVKSRGKAGKARAYKQLQSPVFWEYDTTEYIAMYLEAGIDLSKDRACPAMVIPAVMGLVQMGGSCAMDERMESGMLARSATQWGHNRDMGQDWLL